MTCSCGHAQSINARFGQDIAHHDLIRYRKRGPDHSTRMLLDLVRTIKVEGAELLDIGGGIGVVSQELLRAGVASSTHVEASDSYREAAEQEAGRQGTGDRMRFISGDFVEVADQVPPADIVTLDRVVCCYPDHTALLETAARHARRCLALTFPRDRWVVRLWLAVENLIRRLTGNAFRAYLHDPDQLATELSGAGLSRVAARDSFIWTAETWMNRNTWP
jgi:Methyltransferase domain